MADRRIIASLLNLRELPTLPIILTRITAVTDDVRASAQDLTAIIEKDQAITARILRLANSPYYGLPRTVDSIRCAVVLLGFDAVRNLALAMSVVDAFSRTRQKAIRPEEFWMHAFGTAKAAQALCDGRCWVQSPEGCFTLSLLHDIGKYLFAVTLRSEYGDLLSDAYGSRLALSDVEHERFGTTHTEVGAWLMNKWRLPPMFEDVIGNLYRFSSYRGPYKSELAVVALANSIARLAGFGARVDWEGSAFEPALLDTLRITEEHVAAVLEIVERSREETKQLLDYMD